MKATKAKAPRTASDIDYCIATLPGFAPFPSWHVIVDGVIVGTWGLGRARREADKRGGKLAPSTTVIGMEI